jgi:hypothetical protein
MGHYGGEQEVSSCLQCLSSQRSWAFLKKGTPVSDVSSFIHETVNFN